MNFTQELLPLIERLLCIPLLLLAILAGARALEHLRQNGGRWY